MRHLADLFLHLLATVARLLGPGGAEGLASVDQYVSEEIDVMECSAADAGRSHVGHCHKNPPARHVLLSD